MSVWDWVREYRRDAAARGDAARLRLTRLEHDAADFMESDPDRALALLDEGRRLAVALHEPRWALFYDHWRLQVLLHHKCDYREAGDLAVRAALEARKPAFADLPQRNCLQEDLINYYLGVDPVGHEAAVEQALSFMEQEVAPDMECRFCLATCRTRFERERGRPDAARAAGLRALALAEDDGEAHYAVNAHTHLCHLAFLGGDLDALREYATGGEELARALPLKQSELATFVLWQALLARRDGDEGRARRLQRAASARMGRLKAPPGEEYFDAWAAYHEEGGNHAAALQVRDRQLAGLAGTGQHAYECRARLRRCRLLARLDRLTDADLDAARAAAGRLRRPAAALAELARLAGGPEA
jgi:hypothetical protein